MRFWNSLVIVCVGSMLGIPGVAGHSAAADPVKVEIIRHPGNLIEVRHADGSAFDGRLQFVTMQGAGQTFVTLERKVAATATPTDVETIREPNGHIEVRNADGPTPHRKIQSITEQGAVETIVVLDKTELTTPPPKSSAATDGTDAGEPPVADATEQTGVRICRHPDGFIELRNVDGSPFEGDVEVVAALIGGKTHRFLTVKDAGKPASESSPASDEPKDAKAAGHGRYHVSGGEMPVMVDTATGQSWVLVQFGKSLSSEMDGSEIRDRLWWTWIPTRRVDDFTAAKELIGLDREVRNRILHDRAQQSIRVLPRRSEPAPDKK